VCCLEMLCHQTEGKFIQGEKQKNTHLTLNRPCL
jgi:hypothetical protein